MNNALRRCAACACFHQAQGLPAQHGVCTWGPPQLIPMMQQGPAQMVNGKPVQQARPGLQKIWPPMHEDEFCNQWKADESKADVTTGANVDGN